MNSNEMPTEENSLNSSVANLVDNNIRKFEIKKLRKADFKPYEIGYINGLSSMAIKRFTKACGI